MAILAILAIAALIGLIVWPQFWVKRVMKQHGAARTDFPDTGGELATHLVEHFELDNVNVEATDQGDHYDPETRTVRLSKDNFDNQSLTAVAVAAHEVGHALQHARGETGLKWRQWLVSIASVTDKIAAVFFIAAPILTVIVRSPAAFIGLAAIGIGLLGIRVLVHLVTLPVEYDASFGKALPILEEGNYLHEDDLPGARSVLKAAAFTYVASALLSLIDLARWIRILR